MDKVLGKIPNMAPDGPLGTEKKGPLSAVGDPVGQVLKYSLKPVGCVTGAIGNPNGQALLDVEAQAKKEMAYLDDKKKPDAEKPGGESIGGKQQTAQNPLGL